MSATEGHDNLHQGLQVQKSHQDALLEIDSSSCKTDIVGMVCREKQLQLFWEVFPARDGLTTYMFAYTDPTPGISAHCCFIMLRHHAYIGATYIVQPSVALDVSPVLHQSWPHQPHQTCKHWPTPGKPLLIALYIAIPHSISFRTLKVPSCMHDGSPDSVSHAGSRFVLCIAIMVACEHTVFCTCTMP